MKLTSVFQYVFGTICAHGSFHRTLSLQWRFQHPLPEKHKYKPHQWRYYYDNFLMTNCVHYTKEVQNVLIEIQIVILQEYKKLTLTESIPSSSLMSPMVSKTHISPSTEADTSFSFLLGWKRTYRDIPKSEKF